MKKIGFLILGMFIFSLTCAQDNEFKTIFQRDENKQVKVSGFGGPMMMFSSIDGRFAHLMGGGGGIMLNSFFFGGYGVGLTTPVSYKNNTVNELEFGHGGFWFGFILGSHKPVHLSLSSLAGWGSIAERNPGNVNYELVNSEPVFVVTPVVELELNFSRFFKLGAGSSMSFVKGPGIDRTAYKFNDFAKPSLFLSFKFGWFY